MKRRNMIFKFNPDIDKAYRQLFGTSPAGCAACGNDSLDDLGIHKVDDRPGLQVLCDKCYGAPRQSFDNKLQKQIGGSYV